MTKAERLADLMDVAPKEQGFIEYSAATIHEAATELRRLSVELEALKKAISKAEPVAWKHDCAVLLTNDVELWIDACPHCGKPRTHPAQQAKPQPLSDEQKARLFVSLLNSKASNQKEMFDLIVSAVEATHGIKE